MIQDAFEQLGLALDADEKAIKRAYAQRLKTCRPDDDPAGFQRLNDAYQRALQWCHSHAPAAATVSISAAHDASPVPEIAAQALRVHVPPPAQGIPTRSSTETFLRQLASLAVRGDAGALRAWLENHPDLWSLQLKQQLGTTLLRNLAQQPIPMPATCFDTLLAYFELDQVARGADGFLLARLREACHHRYAPIGRYLTQLPLGHTIEQTFESERFLAQLRDLCMAGDAGHLWAWLQLQVTGWSSPERQRAGATALAWLRAEALPMPSECYEPLAGCFAWPADALGDAQATQSALADRHLTWLLLPAHTRQLARVVQHPGDRYPDIPRTQRIRDLLSRPFSWPGALLRALSPSLPRELAGFISRLRAAAGLKGKQVRLLERHLDARSLRFWSDAAAPDRLTMPKLAVWGTRTVAVLAIEALIGTLVGWWMGPAAFGERYVGMLVVATFGLALYAVVFHLLLFWQILPGPHSRLATLSQAGFVPLLCAIALSANMFRPSHYLAIGIAITALLLALLTYIRRDRARPKYANPVLLVSGIIFTEACIGAGTLPPGWMVGFALLFWTLDMDATHGPFKMARSASDTGQHR